MRPGRLGLKRQLGPHRNQLQRAVRRVQCSSSSKRSPPVFFLSFVLLVRAVCCGVVLWSAVDTAASKPLTLPSTLPPPPPQAAPPPPPALPSQSTRPSCEPSGSACHQAPCTLWRVVWVAAAALAQRSLPPPLQSRPLRWLQAGGLVVGGGATPRWRTEGGPPRGGGPRGGKERRAQSRGG